MNHFSHSLFTFFGGGLDDAGCSNWWKYQSLCAPASLRSGVESFNSMDGYPVSDTLCSFLNVCCLWSEGSAKQDFNVHEGVGKAPKVTNLVRVE